MLQGKINHISLKLSNDDNLFYIVIRIQLTSCFYISDNEDYNEIFTAHFIYPGNLIA
jgi:hypothetical protein